MPKVRKKYLKPPKIFSLIGTASCGKIYFKRPIHMFQQAPNLFFDSSSAPLTPLTMALGKSMLVLSRAMCWKQKACRTL
jgi:hypothetical protein